MAEPEVFGLQSVGKSSWGVGFTRKCQSQNGNSFLSLSRMERPKTGAKKAVAPPQGALSLGARIATHHTGLRLFANASPDRFWLGVWLMLAMKIALSDDRGLLE